MPRGNYKKVKERFGAKHEKRLMKFGNKQRNLVQKILEIGDKNQNLEK